MTGRLIGITSKHPVLRIIAANVKSVVWVIEDYDYPFTDDTADFVTFDTKAVLSDKIAESIRAAQEVGTAQYQIFVTDRLTDPSKLFYEPIPKMYISC